MHRPGLVFIAPMIYLSCHFFSGSLSIGKMNLLPCPPLIIILLFLDLTALLLVLVQSFLRLMFRSSVVLKFVV